MALFEKKFCDFCGEKIGLLGNRKLEDGNMCKDCASAISPWLTDRRRTTVAEMKEHLASREANKAKIQAFRPTETYGNTTKVYIDRAGGNFVVTRSSNYIASNADVIPLSEVSGVEINIDEDKEEIFREVNGQRESFNPKKYKYEYSFEVKILVSDRWFSEINFTLSDQKANSRNDEKYHRYEQQAYEIKYALTGLSGAAQGGFQQGGFSQGMPQQGFPQQNGYQQGMNQQGYPQQGGFPQGMNQQGYPQQGGFPQGMNQQGFPQQNGFQQGMNQQGFPQQNGFPQGMNQQGYPQQNGFPQGMNQQGYAQQNGFQQGMNQQGYPQQGGFSQGMNQQGFPQQGGFAAGAAVMGGAVAGAAAGAAGAWVCPACGTNNTANFCAGCGSPRPQQAASQRMIRCDKCGWTATDPNNIPKFCPNCGDPINMNDVIG